MTWTLWEHFSHRTGKDRTYMSVLVDCEAFNTEVKTRGSLWEWPIQRSTGQFEWMEIQIKLWPGVFFGVQSFVIYSLRRAKSALRFSLQGRLHQSGWLGEPVWERMSVTRRASVACGDVAPSFVLHLPKPLPVEALLATAAKPVWEEKAAFGRSGSWRHHCLSLWDDTVKAFRHIAPYCPVEIVS